MSRPATVRRAASGNELSDARRFLRAYASDLCQNGCISSEDPFDGAEMTKQAMRYRRTDAGSPCSRYSRLDARRFGFRSNRRSTRSCGALT